MKSLDQSAIRKQNVRNILELLTLHSPRTRQSLADATGLSLMTVTNLIDQLKEQFNAEQMEYFKHRAQVSKALDMLWDNAKVTDEEAEEKTEA